MKKIFRMITNLLPFLVMTSKTKGAKNPRKNKTEVVIDGSGEDKDIITKNFPWIFSLVKPFENSRENSVLILASADSEDNARFFEKLSQCLLLSETAKVYYLHVEPVSPTQIESLESAGFKVIAKMSSSDSIIKCYAEERSNAIFRINSASKTLAILSNAFKSTP